MRRFAQFHTNGVPNAMRPIARSAGAAPRSDVPNDPKAVVTIEPKSGAATNFFPLLGYYRVRRTAKPYANPKPTMSSTAETES